jgi:hypothetical protein
MKAICSSKRMYLATEIYGVTYRKSAGLIFINTADRKPDLAILAHFPFHIGKRINYITLLCVSTDFAEMWYKY